MLHPVFQFFRRGRRHVVAIRHQLGHIIWDTNGCSILQQMDTLVSQAGRVYIMIVFWVLRCQYTERLGLNLRRSWGILMSEHPSHTLEQQVDGSYGRHHSVKVHIQGLLHHLGGY